MTRMSHYAVLCEEHGSVRMTQEVCDYQDQQSGRWLCPICLVPGSWDDTCRARAKETVHMNDDHKHPCSCYDHIGCTKGCCE